MVGGLPVNCRSNNYNLAHRFNNMTLPFLLSFFVAADPTPEQRKLLQLFRSEFVAIIPGKGEFPQTLKMGREGGPRSERPVHVVTFRQPFFVAKYEVPQNLWEAVSGNNPSKWKGPRNSVEMLSFDDAQRFCERATRLMRSAELIAADEVVRLPSEAEWEYIARAGTETMFSFGDNPTLLNEYGWFTGNAKGNDPPVGAKKPNPWGLYDMHGYLWEWCQDTWHADYQGAPVDGSAWIGGAMETQHVLRGGSWKDSAEKLISSYRRGAAGELRDDAVGLRCVLAKGSRD